MRGAVQRFHTRMHATVRNFPRARAIAESPLAADPHLFIALPAREFCLCRAGVVLKARPEKPGSDDRSHNGKNATTFFKHHRLMRLIAHPSSAPPPHDHAYAPAHALSTQAPRTHRQTRTPARAMAQSMHAPPACLFLSLILVSRFF